jgi:hypothetical protein
MFGSLPPGMTGRLELTPGQKGNPAAQYDPLPGDAERLQSLRRRGRARRMMRRLSARRSKG